MKTTSYEMNPMKRLECLYSWAELYSKTKDKVKHSKIQLEISDLREQIVKTNTINKN